MRRQKTTKTELPEMVLLPDDDIQNAFKRLEQNEFQDVPIEEDLYLGYEKVRVYLLVHCSCVNRPTSANSTRKCIDGSQYFKLLPGPG